LDDARAAHTAGAASGNRPAITKHRKRARSRCREYQYRCETWRRTLAGLLSREDCRRGDIL